MRHGSIVHIKICTGGFGDDPTADTQAGTLFQSRVDGVAHDADHHFIFHITGQTPGSTTTATGHMPRPTSPTCRPALR